MEKLVLVHLSDIHFTRASGVSVHDLDKNVRNELVLDATKVAKEIGQVTGVLVTGDIAFSGGEAEFEHATSWLRDFCRAIGCPEESVWVVPGNHDVARDKTKRKLTRMLHQGVRKDGSDVDARSSPTRSRLPLSLNRWRTTGCPRFFTHHRAAHEAKWLRMQDGAHRGSW